MSSRPTVSIIGKDGKASGTTHTLPLVFLSPIRPDIVQEVHKGVAKNKRQVGFRRRPRSSGQY